MKTTIHYLSFLLAIVSISLAIYFYHFPKSEKKLTVYIKSITSIIDLKNPVEDLKITYKNESISILFVTELEITNSGSKDLLFDDFINPFSIKLNSQIVDVIRVNKQPESLNFDIDRWTNDEVYFSKSFFKANESISIKIYTLSEPKLVASQNRIVDLPKINITDVKNKTILHQNIIAIFLIIFGLILMSIALIWSWSYQEKIAVNILNNPAVDIDKFNSLTWLHQFDALSAGVKIIQISIVNKSKFSIIPTSRLSFLKFATKGKILSSSTANQADENRVPFMKINNSSELDIIITILDPMEEIILLIALKGSEKIYLKNKNKSIYVNYTTY